MKLHLDEPAFETLLLDVAGRTGIRADIIEKDYYVTLLLNELAGKQKEVPAYFKGGTALYKALGSIRRFKDAVYRYSLEDSWHKFRDEALKNWLLNGVKKIVFPMYKLNNINSITKPSL